MEILISVYALGFIINLYRSIIALIGFRNMKKNLYIDMFQERPDLKHYLVLKVLIWPYYFVTEKSPLERLSETFFKRYGDKGHCYYGTRGLKNFLNDVRKGKDRYKAYKIMHVVWEITSPLYVKDEEKEHYAEIIVAYHKDQCLLQVMLTDSPFPSLKTISRYVLDNCEKLPLTEVKNRLKAINVEKFENLQFLV
ncbi:TPA: hypothetical protein I8669_002710 [Legionella pneumophila]|nr:hypothetical protein [Legionella pneumophila]